MSTQISRDSYRPGQRYSGVYQQQGRMLVDADLNEFVDVLKARLAQANCPEMAVEIIEE